MKAAQPKAPRTRTRLAVDARREQLLALGLRAFTAHPYDAVSTDAIAAQAGISRGLLFHYFPSKHAYYVAVLRVAAEELLASTVAGTQGGSPAERLHAGLHAYFRFVEERGATYATLLRGGVGSDPVVQELVESTRGRFVDTITRQLEALVADPGPRAEVRAALRGWIGLVEALALDWIDHRDLDRDGLVALAYRGVALVVPHAGIALAANPRRRRRSRRVAPGSPA